ncbi:hypothetical protein PDIG_13970 [Penicillium digitatum PHI26]|uniref:Uncharacterized protein n=2 Tax=Penicillium digitatum TaxID=36651 RepID=K9GSK3_PEND2|nr:hypothetical protein PDIP_39620 [Penicillium digitatum Pd1]EKV15679.1 hypothetical protein PDIP_39620 [Penicillium digitatum Pd1]EKV17618.1 hypothetical protein PDIG_13970 [Penicillium digitatum PHI26]
MLCLPYTYIPPFPKYDILNSCYPVKAGKLS